MNLRILVVGLTVLVAACVPPAAPPPPLPKPAQPAPAPLPPVPPTAQDWRDLPLSQGNWYYNDQGAVTQALFGPANAEAAFILRCDRARRLITLSRAGVAGGTVMTIRTTATARNYPVSVQVQPMPHAFATTSALDRFLDEIAFSRGRFSVELPGTARLVLPTWPEPARVIEDCRG